MPSISALSIALSGLKVAQAQISVTSNNIANVSTEGYSRKSINLYSTVMGNTGTGVNYSNVVRKVDELLMRDYRRQVSATTCAETTLDYLTQIQNFHGSPDSEEAISSYVSKLKSAFAQLADQPESTYLRTSVYTTAQQVIDKFNDFSDKITELRNNTQEEMSISVNKINTLTAQIAELNVAIKTATSASQSTAELEDKRDIAIQSLAEEMDLSYFKTQDNVVMVMTNSGQFLADTTSVTLHFSPDPMGPAATYPTTAAAITTDTGVDLTAERNLGGRLGALIELRDDTLPTYQAELDEQAHKMAVRFAAEGLELFTLPNGTIPANNPTAYVGFSSSMIINPDITDDYSLLTKGTSFTSTVQDGSSEVLRKIVEFTFGTVEYQQGRGTVDISDGVATLMNTLGITGTAKTVGTENLLSYTNLDSNDFINPGTEDTFSIAVGSGLPQDITITAGMTPNELVNAINTAYPGMAKLGSGGEMILTANDTITIAAGTLSDTGLNALGLTAGITATTPPSFKIAVGNNEATTIQINSTDTGQDLLDKLNAVDGVTATFSVDGYLNIVPTNGGDISLVDGTDTPLAQMGVTITDIPHTAFNTSGLGPAGTLEGGVKGAESLYNYASQMISLQAQQATAASTQYETSNEYRAVLEKEFVNETAVNLDEEMSDLINIQTAYSASAHTIQVAQEMLDELMQIF